MVMPIESIHIQRKPGSHDRVEITFRTSDPTFAKQIEDFGMGLLMVPGFHSADFMPTGNDTYELIFITDPDVIKVSHLEPRI